MPIDSTNIASATTGLRSNERTPDSIQKETTLNKSKIDSIGTQTKNNTVAHEKEMNRATDRENKGTSNTSGQNVIFSATFQTIEPRDNSLPAKNNSSRKKENFTHYYLPDWSDKEILKKLTSANPEQFTILETSKTLPQEYKLKLSITDSDWIFWFIIGSLATFAWIKIFFGKIISATLSACINSQITNRLYRESNSLSMKISFALSILFSFNLAIFAFQSIDHFKSELLPFKGYFATLTVFISVLCLYLVKFLFLKTVGYLADIAEPISEYLNIVNIYNKSLGMLLFPIIVSAQYLKSDLIPRESIFYAGFSLITIAYLMRIVRGFVISVRSNFSIFYAILYLCALEIAPNVLLYKIAISL